MNFSSVCDSEDSVPLIQLLFNPAKCFSVAPFCTQDTFVQVFTSSHKESGSSGRIYSGLLVNKHRTMRCCAKRTDMDLNEQKRIEAFHLNMVTRTGAAPKQWVDVYGFAKKDKDSPCNWIVMAEMFTSVEQVFAGVHKSFKQEIMSKRMLIIESCLWSERSSRLWNGHKRR